MNYEDLLEEFTCELVEGMSTKELMQLAYETVRRNLEELGEAEVRERYAEHKGR